MLVCAVVMIVAPVVMSSMTGEITATDWVYRHAVWINRYLEGDFSPILLYPPLFQFVMLPFVALGFPMGVFQVVFIILATFGILYMTGKLENEKAVLYMSFFMASAIIYVEFASALMPQSLDYLFFSFAILFYYQDKVKYVIPLLSVIFGMHIMGTFFVLILFVHALLTKRKKMATALFGLGLIFFIISAYYTNFFCNYFYEYEGMEHGWVAAAQAEWENRYLNPIWNLFFFSGFMTWILLPYAVWKLHKEKFKLTDTQLLYIIWIMVFFILMIMGRGVWRGLSYQFVPLSLLVASLVSKK